MKRYHEERALIRSEHRFHLRRVHNWPKKPVDCECELQAGRFRKKKALDCGKAACLLCHYWALEQFVEDLRAHNHTLERVDLALVTFGSAADVVRDFAPIVEFRLPTLSASGLTSMGEAINVALDLIGQRIQAYRDQGVPFYKPIVLLITDGSPTDSWDHAMNRLHRESSLRRLSFIAVGIDGADMDVLTRISPAGSRPIRLKDLRFSEIFRWVSSSIQATSRADIGDEPALVPPPDLLY